ncbi:taurine dioxygenase [Streptomyces melanogenes]|nr:taurine dioxygenase [Streptomyces melanogenes]
MPPELLRKLLASYGLVILRGLRLAPSALAAFSQHLGVPQPHPQQGPFPAHPDSRYVQVVRSRTDGSAEPYTWCWHTDSSSRLNPPRYTLLQAAALPETGGDTLFADMVSAYRHLPPHWKHLLEGAVGIHVHPLWGGTARHPVITMLPDGRQALYLNHVAMSGIESPRGTHGPGLIDSLIAYATQEDFVYRHCWGPDEILAWDNNTVMHRATPLLPGAHRVMHRLAVASPQPH